MCGIVGIAVKAKNGFTKGTEEAFFDMLFVDTLRGEDSTGIIYIEKDASFGIMKEAVSGAWGSYQFQHDAALKGMWNSGKAYIGHNRKKTVGAIADNTAHPFVVDGKFAMVHNGTLYNHKALADTSVDSEALTIHLSKVLNADYTKEKLEEALGEVYGAYAIAAYNQDTNKIYLTRNKDRPLAMLKCDEGWIWASEGLMLPWIAARNGLGIKDAKIIMIEPNTLITIDLDTNKVETEVYEPKKPAPVTPAQTTKTTPTLTLVAPTTGTVTTATKMSKNEFKKIKRRFLGKNIMFFAADYIEKAWPKTIAEGEHDVMLMGECETFNFNHTVQGEFDIYDLPPTNSDLIDTYYYGKIYNMVYETSRGYVSVSLCDLKPVPSSKAANETTPLALTLH